MPDLRAMLGERYPKLTTAISTTVGMWLGHDTPSSPHSWRCEDKTRYPGPCGCDGEMANEVMGVLEAILPGLLAQAWDEGHRASERDWEMAYDLSTPDEDRQPWTNPYRQENEQ